jgi:hypothetical protein
MPAPRCRKFGVFDAMALVAATAVGLWVGRSIDDRFWDELPRLERPDDWSQLASWAAYRETHGFVTTLASLAKPMALSWTIALLGLRLRGPRPTVRRLGRQPGFSACLAVSLVTAAHLLGGLSSSAERATWGDGFRFRFASSLGYSLDNLLLSAENYPLGAAVAGVWGVMALGRMVPP